MIPGALPIEADDGQGNVQTYTVNDYLAANPGALLVLALAPVSFSWGGVTMSFQPGCPQAVSPDLLAALLATTIGAPVST